MNAMETKEILSLENKNKVFLRLLLHDDSILEAKWIGLTTKPVFFKGMDKLIETFEQYNIAFFIGDITEHKGIGPDSQQYAAQKISEYVQRQIANEKLTSFKQVMVVPQSNIFAKVSANGYTNRIKEGHIETVFTQKKEDAFREFNLYV